ncbi:MAG: enoyl-CoA hydratase/isomerase family protein [Minwuia sp.]|uniref:enoyl-CoA hydratase/isomerase family protein n=1 Tax=Minwuia sp. TaxID=2493630 RepID=UPI003A839543
MHVLDEFADGVLTLTLNRPEKLNAITNGMIAALLAHLDRASGDDAVRTIVLKGAGKAFSGGDDLKSMGDMPWPMPPGAHPIREVQQRLIKRWYWFEKPTVVAMRGRAHGIAEDLLLSADFRVISDSAILGDIRARRAVPVGSGGTWLLPRMIGLPAATRLMLTGDTIGADEMERLNLVSERVPDDELEAAAHRLALRLAKGPTRAMGMLKHQMRRGLVTDFETALELEMEWLDAPVEDREEGRLSFIEGREPNFTGR